MPGTKTLQVSTAAAPTAAASTVMTSAAATEAPTSSADAADLQLHGAVLSIVQHVGLLVGVLALIAFTVVLDDEFFQLLHQPHANHASNLGFVSMLEFSRGVTNRRRPARELLFVGKIKFAP